MTIYMSTYIIRLSNGNIIQDCFFFFAHSHSHWPINFIPVKKPIQLVGSHAHPAIVIKNKIK